MSTPFHFANASPSAAVAATRGALLRGVPAASREFRRSHSLRETPNARRSQRRVPFSTRISILGFLLCFVGCRTVPTTVSLPARHVLEGEQLLVHSDVRLPKDHPLIADLANLRRQIAETLQLPVQDEPVTVYLFSDELRYSQYMKSAFPQLPPRRAYFVGTPKELAVYTFWGERIQEDLRHEYTHGVLHATLKEVPLWLDEGLAEYFEVVDEPLGMNRDYTVRLAAAVESGWRPNLERLERLTTVEQMQKADYQESWAWVHFLLHDSDETRAVLLTYLNDLRSSGPPPKLRDRLLAEIPHAEERLLQHASSLPRGALATSTVGNEPHR